MQITYFLSRITLSSVACPALQLLPLCLINGAIFGEKIYGT